MPDPLQVALFAREFENVLYFTSLPRPVQKLLFAVLVARLLGYRGSYPEYTNRPPSERVARSSLGRGWGLRDPEPPPGRGGPLG